MKKQLATIGLWLPLTIVACSSDVPDADGTGGNSQSASGGQSTGSGGTGASTATGGAQATGSGGSAPTTGGGGAGNPSGGAMTGGTSPASGGDGAGGFAPATGGQQAQSGGASTGGQALMTGGAATTGGAVGTGGSGETSGGADGAGGTDGGTGGDAGNDEPPTPWQGEKYPFPQRVDYPYGLQSAEISSDYVKSWYDSWSANYLQACGANTRPGVDPLSMSVVEAQGFAMVAAAYMGDRSTLDSLYAFYQTKLTASGCGLMGWKHSCDGFEDQGSATDGDIDVASGLIVAHWQWPDAGYDDKARSVISNLRQMIANCGGTSALYPGCSGGSPWGGCNETDASYYSPAFFRYFAEISGDSAWTKLADDTHVVRDAAANPSTGLVPDWQSVSGTAGAGSRKGYFSFDAIRTPYKHALDYIWNGNEPARAWCEKITTWAHGVGVENIRDGYQLNGSVEGSNHNLATVGSMAVCAMANTQTVLDDFVAESVTLPDDYWYSGYLGNLYLLAMSGNMWNPDLVED